MDNTKKIAALLPPDIDAVIVTDPTVRFWLTGFHSTAGTLIVARAASCLIIDFRYIEAARAAVTQSRVVLQAKTAEQTVEFLREVGAENVAFLDDKVTVRAAEEYRKQFEGFNLVFDSRAAQLISEAQMIKSEDELAIMRRAQDVTDAALAAVLPQIKVGVTDREIAVSLEYEMKRRGAQGTSFDFIVVSGAESSKPHGVPTDKKIREGEFVTMDIGAICDGYCSDMTRTVCVGQPTDEMKKVYDTVATAQLMALAAIAPGKRCCDIDKIARDYIYSNGYQGCFEHGLGHSLGVLVHEPPAFSPRCQTVLQPGMVMTVEPGIYLAGRFGVRIEDVVFVTPDGCENITRSPKRLLTL